MFAILFAMTSTLSCCAFMPVAAMASALISGSSDRHPADFLVGLDNLVPYRGRSLERLLGRFDRFDDLQRRCPILQGSDRCRLGALQGLDRIARDLLENVRKARALCRARDAGLHLLRNRCPESAGLQGTDRACP